MTGQGHTVLWTQCVNLTNWHSRLFTGQEGIGELYVYLGPKIWKQEISLCSAKRYVHITFYPRYIFLISWSHEKRDTVREEALSDKVPLHTFDLKKQIARRRQYKGCSSSGASRSSLSLVSYVANITLKNVMAWAIIHIVYQRLTWREQRELIPYECSLWGHAFINLWWEGWRRRLEGPYSVEQIIITMNYFCT